MSLEAPFEATSILDPGINFFVERDRSDWWASGASFLISGLVFIALLVYIAWRRGR